MVSTTMKHGTVVLHGNALQPIPVLVTCIQGQSHRGWLKILKHSNTYIFLRLYDHYSHDTWPPCALWKCLSDHTSLSDLHQSSQSEGLIENREKIKTWHFLRLCDHHTLKTWHNGNLLQGFLSHSGCGDLHPRSQSLWLIENPEKLKHWYFLRLSRPIQPWNLAKGYFVGIGLSHHTSFSDLYPRSR